MAAAQCGSGNTSESTQTMAKEYLSIEEAVAEFGLTEGRISDLVADGKIREYRDAGKIYLKRNEVEAAASEGSSIVDLSADDDTGDSPDAISLDDNEESFASALSSLADSSMALGAIDESPAAEDLPELGSDAGDDTGGSISFADDTGSELTLDDIPEDLPAVPADDASATIASGGDTDEFTSEIDLLGDTGGDTGAAPTLQPAEDEPEEAEPVNLDEMPDLGLSGSSIISLEPNDAGDKSAPLPAAKEDTQVTAAKPKEDSGLGGGISVFDEDELGIESDPLGETQISSGLAEFDAVGSGSGLLDLTQESDDTSLGAELLDVISPTEAADTEMEVDSFEADTITEDVGVATLEDEEAISGPAVAAAPTMAARTATVGTMPGATPMNIMMGLGILAMAMLGLATASVLQGVWPSAIMDVISNGIIHVSVFGGLILVSIVLGIMAILAGRK